MSANADISSYVGGETIAALSSRWGKSARAVVRVSGAGALDISRKVFEPAGEGVGQVPSHSVVDGWFKLGKGVRCPCKVYVFRGPGSYTGEDLVEYHMPGGPGVVQMAMAALAAAGARSAQRGEFTLRAFLAGKLDLAQAEAVAAIIASETDAQLRAANSLAEGSLSRAVGRIQEQLAELIGELEANIDFVDQDIEFVRGKRASSVIEVIKGELDGVLSSAIRWGELESEPRVVLAGWVNVGKSTLLNALSGRSRAIVSGVSGTTRDVLMAPMKVGDTTVLLMDAAGLCDSSLDEVGLAAREAAAAAVRRADLVLYVVDATVGVSEEQWQTLEMLGAGPRVIVLNKTDLMSEYDLGQTVREIRQRREETVVTTSAKTGEGLDELRRQISEYLRGTALSVSGAQVVLTGRGEEGLRLGAEALARAKELLGETEAIEEPELVVMELYEANAALGAITGQISSEEVLADIFSRFCVGK